jgi:signal peptidase I
VTEASAPAPAKKKSGFRLWPLLSGLVLAGALIGGLAYLVLSFKLYKVPQNGMFPTIDAGETLVGQRKPYGSVNDVQRGDIVVFTVKQGGKDVDFIWRVIGLPGEEVGPDRRRRHDRRPSASRARACARTARR